jgi:DNA repair photolyase
LPTAAIMMRSFADLTRPAREGAVRQLPLALQGARTVTTPEFAGMTFLEVETKSALNKVSGMPFGWSINPYRGCSHACSYCFARPTHRYLELSPGEDFERVIVVKTNVVEVLRAELARPSWRGEKVALGTNTDPYQRCEGRYRLMPGIISALAGGRTPLSILTKGTLITRDKTLLAEAAGQVDVTAALTIGMLDDHCWRTSEPGTPHPRARLNTVRALNDAGVPTGVMLAPIMPGINDDRAQLASLIDAAAAAGATHITPIVLHLRPGVREVFWPWLERTYPGVVGRYRTLYRGSQAPRDYRDSVQRFVEDQRKQARRRYGRSENDEPLRDRFPSRPPAETVSRAHGEQLRLI